MNKHQHHSCNCEHSKLAYCQKCKVPHCLDCGMEWVEKQAGYWYYPYVGNTTGIFNTDQITVTSGTSTLTKAQFDALSSQTVCSHEN
jgi:hypothetical protein